MLSCVAHVAHEAHEAYEAPYEEYTIFLKLTPCEHCKDSGARNLIGPNSCPFCKSRDIVHSVIQTDCPKDETCPTGATGSCKCPSVADLTQYYRLLREEAEVDEATGKPFIKICPSPKYSDFYDCEKFVVNLIRSGGNETRQCYMLAQDLIDRSNGINVFGPLMNRV
jgi:hypothetical protein